MQDKWILTTNSLPKEGEVVQTMSPTGMEQDLKRNGNLWFFPDGSMYVYYTPNWWKRKPLTEPPKPSQP